MNLAPRAVRAASFVGGVAILYHEVVIAETGEWLFVFVGLWLAGAPVADLLDKLRRLARLPGDAPPPETPEAPPEIKR